MEEALNRIRRGEDSLNLDPLNFDSLNLDPLSFDPLNFAFIAKIRDKSECGVFELEYELPLIEPHMLPLI